MSLKVDFIVYFVSCQFHTSYALLVNSMIMMMVMMKINIIVAIDMTSATTAASYCRLLRDTRFYLSPLLIAGMVKVCSCQDSFRPHIVHQFFSLLLWVKSGKTLIAKIKTLQYSQHLLFHHQLLKLEYRFTTLYLPKIYAQYRRQSKFLTITRSETINNNWTTNILPKQLCIVI